MTAPLRDLIIAAESRLDDPTRERLAALVESFLDTHDGSDHFTASERVHLRALDAEPFDPADPAEVAALFARRG